MDAIFIYLLILETVKHLILFNLPDKINLERGDKYVALSNPGI